jgi:hypothetical protein
VARGLESGRARTTNGDLADVHLALPAMFAHCALINFSAMIMSIIGGLLIYGTIISFTMFFQEEQEF